MRLTKYSELVVRAEAHLFLQGFSIPKISEALNIPISTVSWHLIYPLYEIDPHSWVKIRRKLRPRAKSQERAHDELWKELELHYKFGECDNIWE